jgi:hypothetical protein
MATGKLVAGVTGETKQILRFAQDDSRNANPFADNFILECSISSIEMVDLPAQGLNDAILGPAKRG